MPFFTTIFLNLDMDKRQAKEEIEARTKLRGQLKSKFECHLKDANINRGSLLKLIMSEYYSKVNTDYNK